MSLLEKKSDYDLLHTIKLSDKIKGTKTKCKEILYTRYKPLIYKIAKGIRSTSVYSKEDFMSDAYESMLKAVDYINFDKIDQNFHFGMIFKMFLQIQRSNIIKSSIKDIKNTISIRENKNTLSQFKSEPEVGNFDSGVIYRNKANYENITHIPEKLITDIFNDLTPIQRKISDLRQQNVTLKDIAKKLDISYGKTHLYIHKAKVKINEKLVNMNGKLHYLT